MHTQRRTLLTSAAAVLVLVTGRGGALAATASPIELWKSPTCGCCSEWLAHMEAAGFKAVVHDIGNNAARAKLGMPVKLGSCHTARVAGYVLEGHVPASDVRRLLRERPDALGLAVPGMPLGSPGMEQGGQRDAYDVLLVRRDGQTSVFTSYR